MLRNISTCYSIRSMYNDNPMGWNWRSWAFEGSLDGKNWIQLDHGTNNVALNDGNTRKTCHMKRIECYRIHHLMESPSASPLTYKCT